MTTNITRFSCNACGICCKGRLIPLTLAESKEWLERGHDIAVILEAFQDTHWPLEPDKTLHNHRRSAKVHSGTGDMNVIAIFAGNALTQCPNLGDNGLCGIYEHRPLVCRIYPMEISPFIPLKPETKICPPETWGEGEIISSDRAINPVLAEQIEQSRIADGLDAHSKVAISELMGFTVAAWKDDGFAIHFPDRNDLINAINLYESGDRTPAPVSWTVRVDDKALRDSISDTGISLEQTHSGEYAFHKL